MRVAFEFLYLALLTSSSGPWRVGSGRVASGWKYAQPDSGRVENVGNPTFGSGRIQNVNPKPDPTISLDDSVCRSHCVEF